MEKGYFKSSTMLTWGWHQSMTVDLFTHLSALKKEEGDAGYVKGDECCNCFLFSGSNFFWYMPGNLLNTGSHVWNHCVSFGDAPACRAAFQCWDEKPGGFNKEMVSDKSMGKRAVSMPEGKKVERQDACLQAGYFFKCQSELVHETNIILSFVPLAASLCFGSFWVFFITSLCSAVFDLLFVMMQRYNRPRIVSMILRQRQNL